MIKKFKTFHIHAGTYDFGINFVISEDKKRTVKYLQFKLGDSYINESHLDCLGKVFDRHGYCPIVWLPKKPKSPSEVGTLYHELFHIVCCIMRWANIPLSSDSEEAYCHLIKHITRQFFEKIK